MYLKNVSRNIETIFHKLKGYFLDLETLSLKVLWEYLLFKKTNV